MTFQEALGVVTSEARYSFYALVDNQATGLMTEYLEKLQTAIRILERVLGEK